MTRSSIETTEFVVRTIADTALENEQYFEHVAMIAKATSLRLVALCIS